MIVLHGTWCLRKDNTRKFCFWGESSEGEIKRPKRTRKQKAIDHPFQASEGEIVSALKSLEMTPSIVSREQMTALLPTGEGIPNASAPFLDPQYYETKTDLKLIPWKVSCVLLPALETFIWLGLIPEKGEGSSPQLSIGQDIRFWSAAAKFGLELLTRQRFVPSVKDTTGRLCAVWRPVINHTNDIERFALLAKSMPPVCRAFVTEGGKGNHNPYQLITDFLSFCIDEGIRKWLSEGLSPGLKERLFGYDNLASLWLKALCSTNPEINGTTHQIKTLKESIPLWSEGVQVAGKELPWRTSFRLEEPESDGDKWAISFHLQATDDKSLFLPAPTLWKKTKSTVKLLKGELEIAQERFLQDIAKASRLFPPLEKSLQTAHPASAPINTEQSYTFLKEGAWLLEESGFNVLVPSWWAKGAKPGIRLTVKSPKPSQGSTTGFFTLSGLVDFDWQIAIGDEKLSKEELEKIAQLKLPLVQVRGRWVEINQNDIDSAMKFLNKIDKEGLNLGQALHLGLAGEGVGLDLVGFDIKGWLKDVIYKEIDFKELETPPGFKGELRPYQLRGYSWLAFLSEVGLGACLADDMGLGKTIQALALLLHKNGEKRRKRPPGPVLLICPTSVVGNWRREIERFAPSIKILVHYGSERYSGREFLKRAKGHDLIISTYSLTLRDKEDFSKVSWEGVILDEAQNIKNPFAKQAQAVRTLARGYRIALTGTPVENRLTELWSIMEFLNPGYLGPLTSFRAKFANPIERYKSHETSERLRKLIQPFILRRLKTDKTIIKDLPEKVEIKVYCTLSREQVTLYQATVDDMMLKIEESKGINRKGLILSTLTKLKQVCDHPALFLQDRSDTPRRSEKLNRLCEMMEEVLSEDDKALIFTQYVEMGKMLQKHLRSRFGREVLFLHGSIPAKMRDMMISRFQEERDGPPIFVLSIKAGGLGLNLTRANRVFHFDRWWNPAVENQATDRAFRIGQVKNVMAYKFVCLGTLEEKIDSMLEMKKRLAESIVGTDEGWLTELSNDMLRDIFTLRSEEAMQVGEG